MSKLPWLRLYTDTVDNEKIRLLAFEDRWHFIALLCLKQQGVLDDKSKLLDRKISVKLGVQLRELDEIKRRLIEVGLIGENWCPMGWENKQYKSDSSTERTRKYRENKKKETMKQNETSQERHSDALDTDTESEQKQSKSRKFIPPTVEQVREYCEERRNNIDPNKFINHYESTGWMRGKNKIKDWKACVRTWEQNTQQTDNKPLVQEFPR
jgi:hypothetical protein